MLFSTAGGNRGSETETTTAATILSKTTATTSATAPSTDATTTANTTDAEATTATEELLKAPFIKVEANHKNNGNRGVFPWRSSPLLLDRLLPGTDDYQSKGMLLGGNLTSSHPKWDGWATMVFFMEVPFWDSLLFRSAIEQDLAENMAWSFGEAVRELTLSSSSSSSSSRLREMMEPTKLAKLFEAAQEFGSDSLEVKLEHVRKYSKLLDAMTSTRTEGENDDSDYQKSSSEWSRELMDDFREKGECENTILCQVLVPCKETFWVKDRATGALLQGDPNPQIVYHLVRFEQVTKTLFVRGSRKLFPFKHELGNWQITDIDDLCDGNQLL
eukprot:jgi/Psemu1/204661/e_gw1.354.13.1